ncbi:MAG: nickel pincer cofactor biosynthesis protein LarB [Verrucomicrobiota bacterium]
MTRKQPTKPKRKKTKSSDEAFSDLGFAKVDLEREQRCGLPEVIFSEGKTPKQVVDIAKTLHRNGQPILATRVDKKTGKAFIKAFPRATFHEHARLAIHGTLPKGRGTISICCAGTSDLPVAEEAALCAEYFGNTVHRCYDIGVAGLHRLLSHLSEIKKSHVIITVAGMEGALPSVVGGLVDKPMIAVPTSIGYGANMQGLTTLCGMLTSCSSGVTVVNIDNGFGAAYAATQITRLL